MGLSNIKGITIEIDGNPKPLQDALKKIDTSLKTTQSELKEINRLLKLDPKNTELLAEKQKLLKNAIKETEDRLKQLKEAQSQYAQGTAEWDNLQREIVETESKLKGLEDQYKEFGSVSAQKIKAMGEDLKDVGEKITGVGKGLTTKVTLPLAAAGGLAVKSFAEVDKTMQLTNATMGNTEAEAKLLSDAMKEAAANSTFGMSDAATATLNFARAGLDAEQAAAALAPAMNLAAGEGGNLDTVSAGLVATINGFKGSFDDAAHYADVFTNACNNSALDVNSLSEAMSVAAPIFSAAGYSVEDAALYMGVMANNGIDANKAANSLKTGLAKLVSPAKEGADKMKELGISVTNADGSMKDSITIQNELHDAFAKLSESEQIAAASAIFGKNQMAPWLALINTAPSEVGALSEALSQEGTTAEMAQSMMSGFGGSLESLKSSIDVAATSLGEALAPVVSAVAEKIQQAVTWFNGLDESQQRIIATVGLVVAAIGPLLVVIGTLISSIGAIMTAAPAIGAVIGALTGPIGLVIAAIAALVFAGVELYKNWDYVKEKCSEFAASVSEKWEALKEYITGRINMTKENVVNAWTTLKDNVIQLVETLKSTIQQKWEELKTNIAAVIENIRTDVQTKWENIKTTISNAITNAKETVVSMAENIKTTIVENADAAVQYLKDLPAKALQWGKDLINNFIDGIKSAWDKGMSILSDIGEAVVDFIGFSEPKKGPLSNFHTFAPDMMKLYAEGIRDNMYLVTDQMQALSASMAVAAQRPASIYLTNNTVLNGRVIASAVNEELGFLI